MEVEILVTELLLWHAGKYQSVLSTLLRKEYFPSWKTGKYCLFPLYL